MFLILNAYLLACKRGAMRKLLAGLLLLGTPCAGYAEIRTASSLEPILHEIINSPKGTLVLLDVGGTLLAYPDAVLHPCYEAWKYDWFQTHCPAISREEKITLDRIVLGSLDTWTLLDEKWPEVITQAQDHGIKIVAFTKVALDPSVRGSRAQLLRTLGIPFKNDLPELSKGHLYEYTQGVIETEYPLKGPVLEEIITSLAACPEKIIFVDDRMKQIKSVDDACHQLEIPCTAFHYAPLTPTPLLNEKIADYQLSTLVHKHRWVPDSEARSEIDTANFNCSFD